MFAILSLTALTLIVFWKSPFRKILPSSDNSIPNSVRHFQLKQEFSSMEKFYYSSLRFFFSFVKTSSLLLFIIPILRLYWGKCLAFSYVQRRGDDYPRQIFIFLSLQPLSSSYFLEQFHLVHTVLQIRVDSRYPVVNRYVSLKFIFLCVPTTSH